MTDLSEGVSVYFRIWDLERQALLSTLLFFLHYSYMSARRNGDEPRNSCNVQNWLVPVGQYDVSFIKEYASNS